MSNIFYMDVVNSFIKIGFEKFDLRSSISIYFWHMDLTSGTESS